jgi:phenylacetate-CoA ligase
MVIPSGAGSTTRQFRLMQDFGTTVVHATPSFLLHVESKMREEGINRDSLSLRKAFTGAEPYSEDTRRRALRNCSVSTYTIPTAFRK